MKENKEPKTLDITSAMQPVTNAAKTSNAHLNEEQEDFKKTEQQLLSVLSVTSVLSVPWAPWVPSEPLEPSESARSEVLQSPGIQPFPCRLALASNYHHRRSLSCSADSE